MGSSAILILLAKSERRTIQGPHALVYSVCQLARHCENDFAISIKSGQEPESEQNRCHVIKQNHRCHQLAIAMGRCANGPASTKDLLDRKSVVHDSLILTLSLGRRFLRPCLPLSLSRGMHTTSRTDTGGAFLPRPNIYDTGSRCGPICAMMASLVVISSPEDAACHGTCTSALRAQRAPGEWLAPPSAVAMSPWESPIGAGGPLTSDRREAPSSSSQSSRRRLLSWFSFVVSQGSLGGVHHYVELTSHFKLQYLMVALAGLLVCLALHAWWSALYAFVTVCLNLAVVVPWYLPPPQVTSEPAIFPGEVPLCECGEYQ